jgi:hypothetical protein
MVITGPGQLGMRNFIQKLIIKHNCIYIAHEMLFLSEQLQTWDWCCTLGLFQAKLLYTEPEPKCEFDLKIKYM